jgi:hypothetical protein
LQAVATVCLTACAPAVLVATFPPGCDLLASARVEREEEAVFSCDPLHARGLAPARAPIRRAPGPTWISREAFKGDDAAANEQTSVGVDGCEAHRHVAVALENAVSLVGREDAHAVTQRGAHGRLLPSLDERELQHFLDADSRDDDHAVRVGEDVVAA